MNGLLENAQIYNWAQAFAAIIALCCALAAYLTPGKVAGKFRAFMLAIFLWAICTTYMRIAPDPATASFAGKSLGASLMLLGLSFVGFIMELMGPPEKRDRISMKVFFILVFWIFILLPTDLFYNDVHKEYWGWSISPGPAYPLFLLVGLGMVFAAASKISRNYPSLSPLDKERVRFLIASIGLLCISVLSYLLTMYGVAFPYGAIGVAIAMIMMSYSVLRSRIIDFSHFIGKVFAYGIPVGGGILCGLALFLLLNIYIPYSLQMWVTEVISTGFAAFAGAMTAILLPLGRIEDAVLKKLSPKKVSLYRTLDRIGPRIAHSRQPERWIEELEDVLGGVSPMFVPFADRFPHPCPPMEELHPLRRTLSTKRKPLNVETPSKVNPCPAFDLMPSRRDEGWLAVPIFDGNETHGAMVFGPELARKLYSTNDIRKLEELGKIMGRRLSDCTPSHGTARVISWNRGVPVVIDEEQFDTVEDLKASEFFHFYLPEGDSSIEIIFESGETVEKVC